MTANFVKRHPGGFSVHGLLQRPAPAGRVTVLFGPSGCGKTTVLRCLAGLERPESGIVKFDGETWSDAEQGIFLRPQRRGVGFLFQDDALFPHLSVASNVAYGWKRPDGDGREREIRGWLDRFGLSGLERRMPRQLSGGQRQRVALARALAAGPRLLLLDEPLSALDTALREDLQGELRRHLAACGIPVVAVTHDRTEALALGDDLAVMKDGRVLQHGAAGDVMHRPLCPDSARIVGMDNVIRGRITAWHDGIASVDCGPLQLRSASPLPVEGEVWACFRGERVIVGAEGVPAIVGEVQRGLPLDRAALDCGLRVIARVPCGAVEPGNVRFSVPPEAVHLVAASG